MLTPSTITLPLDALSIPPNMFKQVVLPAPEGPKIMASSPFSISNDAFLSAFTITSSLP